MTTPDLALTMPLDGVQWIEASAGTGKTYTLAGLYLRWIVECRHTPREILAVTFTEAATQELKGRLRARLSACVAVLESNLALDAETDKNAERSQAKHLLRAALAQEPRPDLLRRLRLAALDIDHAPILTIHGFCRRALADFGLLAGRALVGDLVGTDKDLIAVATADEWRARATASEASDFHALQAAFKSPEDLASILAKLLPGMRRLLPAPAADNRAMTLLHEAVGQVRERVDVAKRSAGRYSHDDEIRELHEALQDETHGAEIAQRLRDRYPVALIDEFQDTDARQWAIFKAIYAEHGGLILIGDPKQAIYGFRGGDVQTYLRAGASASGKQTLTHNFRSTPAYLRALNALYRSAGSHAFAQAGIDYEPMQPGSDAADNDLLIDDKSATPLTFWCDASDSLHRTSKASAEPRLAAACASAIFDLLIEGRAQLRDKESDGVRPHRPLRPADLAVLVATNDQAHAVWKALSDRGIASASVLSSSVFASEEAGELHTLLDALVDFDEARLRGALATRLFGKTANDFIALAVDAAAWRGELDALAELRRIWQTRGIAAMLQSVFDRRAASVLGVGDGERRMTNWLQLAELAQTASRDGVGLRGLVDWLALRIAQADKDNEDEQLRLESDADRVKIFTLHKSKGLEFPVVFLPFAGLRRGENTRYPRIYSCRDENGNAAFYIATDSNANKKQEAVAAHRAALDDDLAERLRILYVALTRARCAAFVGADPVASGAIPALLHLLRVEDSVGNGRTQEAIDDTDARLRQAFSVLRQSLGDALAVAALPLAETAQARERDGGAATCGARIMPRRVRDDWHIASYSRLADGAPREVRGGGDDEGLSPDIDVAPLADVPASVLRGPRFGTAFHELIEATDFHAWRDGQESDVPASQRALVERIVRRHALTPEKQAVAALGDLVARTLRAPLPIGARLIDLAPGAYRAEMPFHLALAEVDTLRWLALLHEHGFVENRSRFEPSHLHGLMHGILDLVVLHEGRWWVVDYKTNLLRTPAPDAQGDASPYAPAALERAVRDDEYDLQYVIYLMALHRWLRARMPGYDYERDIGGALYLFVRGLGDGDRGIHARKPARDLIEAMDAMFAPLPATDAARGHRDGAHAA